MTELSRHSRYAGAVVHGDKRGRLLGFPTANIAVSGPCPDDGVYSCLIQIGQDDVFFGATVSVGKNPTFPGIDVTRVEAYIHDFADTIYGEAVTLIVIERIRDMQRFDTVEQLIAQTHLDVTQSRRLLIAGGFSTAFSIVLG